MATCPVTGCSRQPTLVGRRVAQHVADLDLFFPMLVHLATLAKSKAHAGRISFSESEINQFALQGTLMRDVMHMAAHGDRVPAMAIPTLAELDRWRGKAFGMTLQLTKHDPEWYRDYWAGVFRSGFKASREIRNELRRHGVPGA